jgi:GNAT superfamily N-acetyltransferase
MSTSTPTATLNVAVLPVEEFQESHHIDNQSIIAQITDINHSIDWDLQNRFVVSYYKKPQTRRFFLVAEGENNNEISGYSTSRPHKEQDYYPEGDYLSFMAVNPMRQGKGIATSLLRSLAERTQATGIRHLSGDYRGNKANLCHLYPSFKNKSNGIVEEYQENPNAGTYSNGDPKIAFTYTLKN